MRQNDLARLGTTAIKQKMPRRTEIADYEPFSRSQTSKILRDEAENNSIGGRVLPDSSLLDFATSNDKQDWRSKTSGGKEVSQQEGILLKQNANAPSRLKQNWIIKRGHAISYAGLFLFTTVLYFRPYEYYSSAEWLTSSASWIAILTLVVFFPTQLALEGNLTTRPTEVNLVLLFCLAGLLSIPFAISPGEAWETFNNPFLKAVLIFLLIVNVVRTERRLNGLFLLTIAVSCLLSFNAVRDYSAGKLAVEGYRIAGSIGGMFANPNDMSLHLITVMPIAIALGLGARNVILKAAYWCTAALMIAAVTVTYSRGGFLGLIAVVVVLTWKLGRRNRLAAMLLLLVGGLLFIALAPGNYGLRLASIFIPGLDPNGSRDRRWDLLMRSLIVALRYPLFGIGMGNFHFRGFSEQVSHNAYTQVAAEMGVMAFVIYFKFLIVPLKRLLVIERLTFSPGKASRYYFLAVGLQASLVGYMVCSFFASVAYYWYIYYLVGYAVCFRRLYEAASGTDLERIMATNKWKWWKKQRGQPFELPTPVGTKPGLISGEG